MVNAKWRTDQVPDRLASYYAPLEIAERVERQNSANSCA